MSAKKLNSARAALAMLRQDYPQLSARAIGAARTGKTVFMDRVWNHDWDSSQYREVAVEVPRRAVSLARRFLRRAGASAEALIWE